MRWPCYQQDLYNLTDHTGNGPINSVTVHFEFASVPDATIYAIAYQGSSSWTKRLRRGREEWWKRLVMVGVGNLLRTKRMIDPPCRPSLFCAFDRKHSSRGLWHRASMPLCGRQRGAWADA